MFCSENFSFCHKFFSLSLSFLPFSSFPLLSAIQRYMISIFIVLYWLDCVQLSRFSRIFAGIKIKCWIFSCVGEQIQVIMKKKIKKKRGKIRRNSSWLQFLCAFLSGGMFWHLPEILFGSLFQSFARRSTKVSSEKRYNNGRNSRSTKKSR